MAKMKKTDSSSTGRVRTQDSCIWLVRAKHGTTSLGPAVDQQGHCQVLIQEKWHVSTNTCYRMSAAALSWQSNNRKSLRTHGHCGVFIPRSNKRHKLLVWQHLAGSQNHCAEWKDAYPRDSTLYNSFISSARYTYVGKTSIPPVGEFTSLLASQTEERND